MATIYGTSGNDTLTSTGPGDTLVGGAGDDLYIIDDMNDKIVELADSAHALIRVSTTETGGEANSRSYNPAFSPDGSKIVFTSDADNLVAGDTNGVNDIFVKDLSSGLVTRVTPSGTDQSNADSLYAVFAGDGNTVVFSSAASNLVAGDTNSESDVFAKDLITGVITRVNTDSNGQQADSPVDSLGGSFRPAVSADGRHILFVSYASNLVAGDTNNKSDLFVKDLTTGVTTLVSTNGSPANGDSGNSYRSMGISADGSKVVFQSAASNLVAGDSNGSSDIFVKDLTTGSLTLVSSSASDIQGDSNSINPVISADGTKVVFESFAHNLVSGSADYTNAVFLKDLTTGGVTLLTEKLVTSPPIFNSDFTPVFSADGSKVAFQTYEALSPNDLSSNLDVYVLDLHSGIKTLVTITATGVQPNMTPTGPGYDFHFSPDGNALIFQSQASGLVDGDSNGTYDVFIKDITPPSGIDTVQSSVSYALGANLENLILTGVADLTGTGNVLNNVLTGNSGKNTLSGASGNDTLDGGTGNDTLIGGVGSDVYYVGTSDVIVENLGSGSDTAISSSSYTLSANVEKLILQGSLNLAGTGNDLANTLTGNSGNNLLIGGLGNDTLAGGTGYDAFLFNTALNASSNVDTIVDLTAQDRLQLSHLIFDQAGPVGTLSGSAFVAGAGLTTGQDSSDRIIYNTTNGKLYYDADGSGAGGSVLFAQLGTTTHPHLASVQIQVV